MSKTKKIILILLTALVSIGIWAAILVKLPYYIESPGGASDIRQVLRVNGKEDVKPGSYSFVYVHVRQATAMQLLFAYFDSHQDIYSEKEMTGGANNEDYYRISQFYMETSQNIAKYQALNLAKKEAKMGFLGVYVLNVADNSSFKEVLHIADTVVAVNGKRFGSSAELIKYVGGLDLGSKVKIEYVSLGKTAEAEGKIVKLSNGKNGIGIGLVDHSYVDTDEKIEFQTAGIGGPSAGLMFTLSIYTQLAEPDLRSGHDIAGTGTIEQDGSVGDIGGTDKKVLSAAKAGAEIFFVPNNPVNKEILKKKPKAKSNYEEALETVKKEKLDIKVVPVKNVQDAIDYLRKLKDE